MFPVILTFPVINAPAPTLNEFCNVVAPNTLIVFEMMVLPETVNFPLNVELFDTDKPVPVLVAKMVPLEVIVPLATKLCVVFVKNTCLPTVKLLSIVAEELVPVTCNWPAMMALFPTDKDVPAPFMNKVPESFVQSYLPIELISFESAFVATIQSPNVLAKPKILTVFAILTFY